MALTFRSYKGAELILEGDSAVEGGHSEYVRSFFDRSKLVCLGDPTVFSVVALTRRQLNVCEQLPAGSMRYGMALALSLREVTGLTVSRDGVEQPAPPIKRSSYGDQMVVDDSWFEDVAIPTQALAELGEYVFRLSSPDPT